MAEQPPKDAPLDGRLQKLADYLSNAVIVGLIQLGLALPYGARVRFFGWVVQHLLGPVAGYKRRALRNLALIYPDWPKTRREGIAARCLNNVGRTFIENYSARDFPPRMAQTKVSGPGLGALEQAGKAGRPVILVTGHFGNYEATRAALVARGFDIGGLYRDMRNPTSTPIT